MSLPLVVTYTVRAEPDWLVAQMRQNVAWADQFVEVDNRAQRGGWGHEGNMRRQQRRQILREVLAGERGNRRRCWVLQLDPDERLEVTAAAVVRAQLAEWESTLIGQALHRCSLSFPLREMWTPTQYRTDNGWADKRPRARLFCFDPAAEQMWGDKPIHQGLMPRGCRCCPGQDRFRARTQVNLYHLKNIEPLNRVNRAAAYLAADPTFQHQRREGKDWTWLYDEDGLTLEELPPGRHFEPRYDQPYQFVQPH